MAFNLMPQIRRVSIFTVVFLPFMLFAEVKTDGVKTAQAVKPAAAPEQRQDGPGAHRAEGRNPAKAGEADRAAAGDTIRMEARLIEIPGKFPSNDLYNYVYIMKYKVIKVLKGTYANREILVGHYNPLIPRDRIREDKKAPTVRGNIKRFEVNDRHVLTLFPLEKVWEDEVETDYSDLDLEYYFALETNAAAP